MATFTDRFLECVADEVKRRGKERGIYADLARHTASTRSAVNAWKEGKSIPEHDNQILIAQFFRVNVNWLEKNHGPKYPEADSDGIEVFRESSPSIRKLHVQGTAALGADGYFFELSDDKAGEGYIEVASSDKDAFVIRFKGQSMYPAIRDGWLGVVEPNSDIQIGEFVLLSLKDGRKMVKELINRRNGHIELMSVNGGDRFTLDWDDIEYAYLVSTIVGPSKFKLYFPG